MEPPSLARPQLETLDLIYDEVAGKLAAQSVELQALNARAQQLLGFSALTVGIVVSLRPPTRNGFVIALFACALLLFASIAGCGLRAWSLQGWRQDPEPRSLWERHRLRPKEWVQHQIILNRLDAVEANAASIHEKLFWVRWTQRLLALEGTYLVALMIVSPYFT